MLSLTSGLVVGFGPAERGEVCKVAGMGLRNSAATGDDGAAKGQAVRRQLFS